jgi:plastocyanin
MGGKFLLGLIVIALGLAVGWYVFGGKANIPAIFPPATTTQTAVVTSTPAPTQAYQYKEVLTTGMPTPTGMIVTKGGIVSTQPVAQNTILYSDTGFSPMVITVKSGTSVIFTNSSKKSLWTRSDPAKGGVTGLDQLKGVANGGTYTYTFTKVGTWKYYNHLAPTDVGTVIVTK